MIELSLPTMSCGHCVRSVTEAVLRLDPQARVEVDLEARRARIETSQPVEAVRAALAEEGYAPA